MKIIIHRGIDQIGGFITEIATDKARILIDLGQNLPNGEGIVDDDLATHEAIGKITQGIDAIFCKPSINPVGERKLISFVK